MKGQFRRRPFKPKARKNKKLDCIAFNVCCLFAEIGHEGSRYMLVMVKGFSKYVKITLLEIQRANSIIHDLMSFMTMLENATGETVKSLLSDNVKEFESEIVRTTQQEGGIIKRVTVLYSLQSNGMAERLNYSSLNKLWTFRIFAGLPGHLWTKLALFAGYIINQTPSTHTNFLSPYQALYSKIPLINHLKVVWQNVIYALRNTNKLEPWGGNGVFGN
jgi:hypothetical protein